MKNPPDKKDLAVCLSVLKDLSREKNGALSDNADYAEILDAAKHLAKASKSGYKQQNKQRERDLAGSSGPLLARQLGQKVESVFEKVENGTAGTLKLYAKPRHCYVCKNDFFERHHFYAELCITCGDLNFQKRNQTADLKERTAIVTGGRVKIGFEVAVKLLRAGARVLVTTRFGQDAAKRFSAVEDFDCWSDRLSIYNLDLRNSPAVFEFSDYVQSTFGTIDILINNAAQTIARPQKYYQHLLSDESEKAHHKLIANQSSFRKTGVIALQEESGNAELLELANSYFPPGAFDLDGQQIDKRPENSWTATVEQVSPVELFEVTLVNSIAPFLLMNKLIPLMVRRPSFIINVSAREGQFNSSWKRPHHPHTNMAKAALNMLTRTCSESLTPQGIYVNSVDTGWVTNEFPHHTVEEMNKQGWSRPIDEIDGAARILDPIFVALNDGEFISGQFLKDYRVAPW